MKRVRALQEELARSGMTAALVVSPENVRYLTGFYVWNSLAQSEFILGQSDSVLVTESGAEVLSDPSLDP